MVPKKSFRLEPFAETQFLANWRNLNMDEMVEGFPGMVAQLVKNLSAMCKTWVQSLGWDDPLEEGMATHSNILAWRIPTDRGAWRPAVHGVSESDKTERLGTAQHIGG